MDTRKPEMYPLVFTQLVDTVVNQGKNVVVECGDEHEARELRRQFYAYRSALRRSNDEVYNLACFITARLGQQGQLTFQHRDLTGPVRFLRLALEGM